MESWHEVTIKQIEEKLNGLKDNDSRFFRIDEFKRNIRRVDENAASCQICKNEKVAISNIVSTIDEAINTPGKKRKEYDKLIFRLSKHMQKTHGFFPPFYFSYFYSFVGMIIGGLLGLFLMQLNPQIKLELFLVGFAIGLLPAYIWGAIKDKKIRNAKRLM